MQTFDWAYLRRLNSAILVAFLIAGPVLAIIPPLASAIILAGIAWFFPDLDQRFRLNNPSYLEKFSSFERARNDERNKRATRWAFVFLAAGHLMRISPGQLDLAAVPWHVMVFSLAAGFILINSMEFLRYWLSLRSETYEELHINQMSISRLVVVPFIMALFFGIYWIMRA